MNTAVSDKALSIIKKMQHLRIYDKGCAQQDDYFT